MVQQGGGGMPGGGGFGGMGGPMEFGKSKSKFSEVPETGVTFDDVAVSLDTTEDVFALVSLHRAK